MSDDNSKQGEGPVVTGTEKADRPQIGANYDPNDKGDHDPSSMGISSLSETNNTFWTRKKVVGATVVGLAIIGGGLTYGINKSSESYNTQANNEFSELTSENEEQTKTNDYVKLGGYQLRLEDGPIIKDKSGMSYIPLELSLSRIITSAANGSCNQSNLIGMLGSMVSNYNKEETTTLFEESRNTYQNLCPNDK